MSSPPPPPPPPPPPSPPPPAATEEEDNEEETTDDDEMDDNDIQWEEWEDDDNDNDEEEEGSVDESGHRGSSRVVVTAMVEAWTTCCVCMEPWPPDGAHRICCIPCGHVYGRSCLEKWLHRRGNTSAAKCPQCRQRFRHKHIINLHVSGIVWDDFCRLQSLSQELEARMAVTDKKIEQLLSVDDVGSNEENEQLRARLAEANNKLEGLLVDIRSEVAQDTAKLRAELDSRIDEAHANNLRAQAESIQQSCWQDAAAVVQAQFVSIKEQMKKMADQHNATPADLLRFMEHNGAKLWEAIRSTPPPAGGHNHN